jgi:hypothetical protein
MAWYKRFIGTDMAPTFKEARMPMGQGFDGPFDTLKDAHAAAQSDLVRDINIMRRSLAALRRGDFHSNPLEK